MKCLWPSWLLCLRLVSALLLGPKALGFLNGNLPRVKVPSLSSPDTEGGVKGGAWFPGRDGGSAQLTNYVPSLVQVDLSETSGSFCHTDTDGHQRFKAAPWISS